MFLQCGGIQTIGVHQVKSLVTFYIGGPRGGGGEVWRPSVCGHGCRRRKNLGISGRERSDFLCSESIQRVFFRALNPNFPCGAVRHPLSIVKYLVNTVWAAFVHPRRCIRVQFVRFPIHIAFVHRLSCVRGRDCKLCNGIHFVCEPIHVRSW